MSDVRIDARIKKRRELRVSKCRCGHARSVHHCLGKCKEMPQCHCRKFRAEKA